MSDGYKFTIVRNEIVGDSVTIDIDGLKYDAALSTAYDGQVITIPAINLPVGEYDAVIELTTENDEVVKIPFAFRLVDSDK
jgi:hypothetical protein